MANNVAYRGNLEQTLALCALDPESPNVELAWASLKAVYFSGEPAIRR